MPWYIGSIWTALTEALGASDMELDARELKRQLDNAHRQLQEQQRQIDSQAETIRELRDAAEQRRQCNAGYLRDFTGMFDEPGTK